MRHEPDFFDGQEMDLLFIGKRLSQSLDVERLLDEADIPYAVEVDEYIGGVIFRSARAGAFFYVLPADRDKAVAALRGKGLKPAGE